MRADEATEPRDGRRPVVAWLAPLLLVVAAGLLRFYLLGHPERIYFDETYYVPDGRSLLAQGVEDGFNVHPPVGKWLVAGGIAVLGDNPVGWRAPMAAAGSLTVLLVYLAGTRLFRHRGAAALAALLVAVDGLAITMSRIAMLDAALTLFVVLGFWLLLIDRERQWQGLGTRSAQAVPSSGDEPPDRLEGPLPRRPHTFRWLAGVAFGLAVATKWSAVLAIGAAVAFVLWSELAFRRRATGRISTAWPRALTTCALTLVLLPTAVYVASYAGWFLNYTQTRPGSERCPDPDTCDVALPARVADWGREQAEIARFHRGLDADHPYQSHAYTWPLVLRPVAHHYESCPAQGADDCVVAPGHASAIVGLPNPAVWWLALVAYLGLAWLGLRRRDWVAGAIGVFLLAQYVPWLLAGRPLFLFYMTPVVPFMGLAVAHVSARVARRPLLGWVPAAVATLAIVALLFWFPVYIGLEIPQESWSRRMWIPGWI